MKALAHLFPPTIYVRRAETKTTATSVTGRRYGDYFWLTISLGGLHFNISPKHVRGIWCSVSLSRALNRL
jgi:hypothetical protein